MSDATQNRWIPSAMEPVITIPVQAKGLTLRLQRTRGSASLRLSAINVTPSMTVPVQMRLPSMLRGGGGSRPISTILCLPAIARQRLYPATQGLMRCLLGPVQTSRRLSGAVWPVSSMVRIRR